MHRIVITCFCLVGLSAARGFGADSALTIYNEDFAVVRESLPLDLKAGTTDVHFADVTAHLEPDSVILRDPAGKAALRVVEQTYRSEPVSQALLLSKFEGQTISFLTEKSGGKPGETVPGKIIRSGYVARTPEERERGSHDADAGESGSGEGPIIEVNGGLRFSLPGKPIFPTLGDDTILKPTLDWKIYSKDAARFDAELAYITSGMDWQADYSVIAPADGDAVDLVGLVTINNQSGKRFEHAKIKLMAGNVNKVKPNGSATEADRVIVTGSNIPSSEEGAPPVVTVKNFDEYHLYSLPLPTSLGGHDTMQVEFTRAAGIPSRRVYIYDGLKIDPDRYGSYRMDSIRGDADYGTESTMKVHVLREFKNSEANGLGIALPKGRLRFYRRDDDGQLEFTGENTIDHTPRDETLSIYSGDAFDLVGARRRTAFKTDEQAKTADESFEIKLRNHKKEPVEIRVVEHLYRWTDWKLTKQAIAWTRTDGQTMRADVALKADEEKTLSYTAHYAW